MREALAPHEEKRLTFTGTFARFGKKRGWKGLEETTVLLMTVRDIHGAVVADHLWCNLTKQFARLDLQPGDVVRFDARVVEYRKGYLGRRDVYDRPPEWDYKLSHPTKISKIDASMVPQVAPVPIEQLLLLQDAGKPSSKEPQPSKGGPPNDATHTA